MNRLLGSLFICGLSMLALRPVSAQVISQTPPPIVNATPQTATPTLPATPTERALRVTATFTPTLSATLQGFAREGSAAIAYPEGIVFQVVFALPPDEIETVRLTLQTAGGAPITLPVTTFEAIEQGTRYEYVWSLPLTGAPDLFSLVTYRWEAAATGGRTAFYQQQIRFEDARVRWQTARDVSSGLEIALPVSALTASRALSLLAEPYRLLVQNTGISSLGRLIFYPPEMDGGCARDAEGAPAAVAANRDLPVPCREAAAWLRAGGWTVLAAPETEDALLEQVVTRFYSQRWGERAAQVPAWFLSGLAAHYRTGANSALLSPSQAAVRTSTALTWAQMNGLPAAEAWSLWQAESYGFVAYIADVVGYDGLYALAEALAEEPFETAYARIVGQQPEALGIEWARWVFSPAAAGAYALTPYDGATPTPAPTQTPSMTRTFAPIPSATASPVPTRSVAPTLRPSTTPTQPPPTTTPRRASSLATPAPTVPPSAAARVPAWGIGGLLFILLILIVALAYVIRRERAK